MKFRKEYNVSEQDEILFLKTLIYDDNTFTDKEVLLDENLDVHEQYIDGNKLYVFIINDAHIKDYNGLIYLKFSLHDEVISFHDTKYSTIKKDYNYIKESKVTEKKQEYFVDFYKDKLGEHEVKVEALYDKNGEELYNGAKVILDVPWGDGKEVGKVVISKLITNEYDDCGYQTIYTYSFKPKKGSQLWIEQDGSNIELV